MTTIDDHAAPPGAAASPGASTERKRWIARLENAKGASSWHDLEYCRDILLTEAADPRILAVGRLLQWSQRALMLPETSPARFAELAGRIEELLRDATLPEQARVVAYADLTVQWHVADLRWITHAMLPDTSGSPY